MITFDFDENNIFCVKFKRKISFEDIKNYLIEFKTFKSLPENLLFLYDLQNADLIFEAKDIERISELADEATKKYKSVKTAFVVSKPKIAAYSILYSGMTKKEKTERQIFSSYEAALEWLLG